MPSVTILYFAQLRDQRGATSECITTSAGSPRELYRDLSTQHHLTLPVKNLVVAVNDNMASWDALLADGDTVVFLPPISGG